MDSALSFYSKITTGNWGGVIFILVGLVKAIDGEIVLKELARAKAPASSHITFFLSLLGSPPSPSLTLNLQISSARGL